MTTTTKQTRSADPLGHPMRRLIRQGLVDNGPAESADIAEVLGEPVSKVAYHVKVLARAGLIEEAGRRQVRGCVATLYRAAVPVQTAGEPDDRAREQVRAIGSDR